MILAAAPWWNTALSLGAALGYAALALGHAQWKEASTRALLAAAWLLHAAVLTVSLLGDTPRFGFGPALSVTAWLVLTVYALERLVYPHFKARWSLAGLGTVAVLLAWWFPGQAYAGLRSAWLPLHWALGIAAYGLLAAAVVHAWLLRRAEAAMRHATPSDEPLPLLALERLTFRFVTAGFVLLSATLLAGAWFAELLHGGWTWNHKTVFSVLSWITLAVLLWGRWRLGWRGRVASRMLYLGAGLLLLGYVGSRFVLEVLLSRP